MRLLTRKRVNVGVQVFIIFLPSQVTSETAITIHNKLYWLQNELTELVLELEEIKAEK